MEGLYAICGVMVGALAAIYGMKAATYKKEDEKETEPEHKLTKEERKQMLCMENLMRYDGEPQEVDDDEN